MAARRKNNSRREHLKVLFTGAIAAALPETALAESTVTSPAIQQASQPPPDHERRIQWWRQAKFGMFVHWGLYSILGRDAWAMGDEDFPLAEYEQLASQFRPLPNAARTWARLARASGMRYIVMTTKHHEGFCLFDSKFTDYKAPNTQAKRDLIRRLRADGRAECHGQHGQ